MDANKMKSLINEHKKAFLNVDGLIDREIIHNVNMLTESKEVIVITGVRRSGKSTLLKLTAKSLIDSGVSSNNILYINFEDERLINFTIDDFEILYNSFLELFLPIGKNYIFLDEIQNIKYWEKWVNRMYELEEVKMFVTGSNSTLLSSEYSGSMTGRNRQITNFPFSFREYLSYKGIDYKSIDVYDKNTSALIKSELQKYCFNGGFPEMVKNEDITLLDQYFKDILFRDIIVKNKIKNAKEIREMAMILASEISSLQSLQKIKNVIGIKSLNSIKAYFNLFAESYLFFQLNKFSYSIKNQIYNPKKIYCIDTGLARSVSFSFSENEGKFYENLVYLELMRRGIEIYYWKSENNNEVDFIIKKGTKLTHAIQVSIEISKESTRVREFDALLAANSELSISNLILFTKDEERVEKYKGVDIKIIPFWKFFINSNI